MPLQSTSGAASYDAFGGGASAKVNYIEDFFQSYLRTGTGASATVTTGLDGSTKKTLVCTKSRSAATNHKLTDNVRGATKALSSNTTGAEATDSQGLTAFSATGYTIGTNTDYNNSGATYVDWQWVAQPKFFDVVTFTGDYTAKTIPHNLGSVPATIIVKSVNNAQGWYVYHRSLGATKYLTLQTTNGEIANSSIWNDTEPTSTVFSVGTNGNVNGDGTYVAYLFAHNAGGFGLNGTDNVISCGSFTTDTSGVASVNLGYEPQWLMFKRTDTAGYGWFIYDSMRGFVNSGSVSTADDSELRANTSAAETTQAGGIPNATGFDAYTGLATATYIYIAIRRGPMKVPTSGTSVFSPISATPTSGPKTTFTTNFPTDLIIERNISNSDSPYFVDRLRGGQRLLNSSATDAESSSSPDFAAKFDSNTNVISQIYNTGYGNIIGWNFRRAPSFFDEVCYTGTGSATTVAHNLGVVPELMIVKSRSQVNSWAVYLGGPLGGTKTANLDKTYAAYDSSGHWNSTQPTASVFSIGNNGEVNDSGVTYVAYLFATCAGVSKVFNYTGNGSSQTINCGFTAGARWILIKRTNSTGDWYVWDSARGIVSGNDPHLSLNTTAAEVTTDDTIDTDSTGFVVNQVSATNVNVSSATYIGIAIA